jgi:predicted MPP superfamily phosphohydrolase
VWKRIPRMGWRLNRRTFLGVAATSVGAGIGLYAWRFEPHWLEVVRRALPIRRLPGRLAGRTLVQLSDVHVGPRVDDDYVLATFAGWPTFVHTSSS